MKREEISRVLAEAGYKPQAKYRTNQELVDNQVALQNGLANVLGQGNQPKKTRVKAMSEEVTRMAEERGVDGTPEFKRFRRDMGKLCHNISANIGGIVGERQGFRSLRPLEYDRDTIVLHNVYLKAGEDATEVDALVVASYGIFVIEIKNCKSPMVITRQGLFQRKTNPSYRYALGERMGCKELLVRQCVANDVEVPIHTMLLYVNDASNLTDEFGKVQVSYRNTIAYDVRAYRRDGRYLTSEQVKQIGQSIEANRIDAAFPSQIDLDALVDNFATLMELMDNTKPEVPKVSVEEIEEPKLNNGCLRLVGRILRGRVAGGVAELTSTLRSRPALEARKVTADSSSGAIR